MAYRPEASAAGAITLTLLLLAPQTLVGQSDRVRLTVTVMDQTGAAIPHATVQLMSEDGSAVLPANHPEGIAGVTVFDAAAGSYTLRVFAPGFTSATIERLALRPPDAERRIRLRLETFTQTVVVPQDRQSASLDFRGFSTVLTREQIDALPDDPEGFVQALRDLAPPGAVIRIDGFSGGSMPSKSQILSIRIPRLDAFAAQDHGGLSALSYIEIVTRPGGGRLQGTIEAALRASVLSARNPLSSGRSPASWRVGTVTADGPIVKDRASFSMSIRAGRQEDTATVRAVLPDGSVLIDNVLRPTDVLAMAARASLRVGASHTLRGGVLHDRQRQDNAGVGDFNLAERGYRSSSSDTALRLAFGGPMGRTSLLESRAQVRWTGTRSRAGLEAPTIAVLDAFTAGGAQVSGGSRGVDVETALDVDYIRAGHAVRAGALLEAGWRHSRRQSNYLGTYTFSRLADFNEWRPATYSRRIGDPLVTFRDMRLGAYIQDDYRFARSMMLNYGLRIETQSRVGRQIVGLPRASVTWSPQASGRTVIRGGGGIFAEWIPSAVYEQVLANDGRQRDILIPWPTREVTESEALALPPERYVLGDGLRLPASAGASIGIERQVTSAIRLIVTYGYRRAGHLLHAHNANPSSGGARPNADFGNVVETRNGAAARGHTMTIQAIRLAPRGRLDFTVAYAFSHQRSNAVGPFTLMPGDLTTEWANTAPLHVATANVVVRPRPGLQATISPTWRAGAPYSITTGNDDNGDGVFNDRPNGVARNSARTPQQWQVAVRVGYSIPLGPSLITSGNSPAPRFRLELFASAQNVANRPTYAAYSGVIGSPFFGQPTVAVNPRRVEIGVRFGF
jgi:hypothetical protein